MVYCTSCGTQNPEGAKFCNDCGASLKGGTGARAPGAPTYARSRRRAEEECLGQTRVPGIVIFAIFIILISVYTLLLWLLEVTYNTTFPDSLRWAGFAIILGIFIILVWAVGRRPAPR